MYAPIQINISIRANHAHIPICLRTKRTDIGGGRGHLVFRVRLLRPVRGQGRCRCHREGHGTRGGRDPAGHNRT
eukprot:3895128-Pyramimonas_sp.AAC.1